MITYQKIRNKIVENLWESKKDYSYLPNKLGDPNKRGGWQIHAIGEDGKIFLLHKNSCRRWKISQNQIKREVKGGICFPK